jgi:hypothetical protein
MKRGTSTLVASTLVALALAAALSSEAQAQDRIGRAVILPAVAGDAPPPMREEAREAMRSALADAFELVTTPRDASLRGCAHGECVEAVRRAASVPYSIALTVWTEPDGRLREIVVTIEDADHRYQGSARADAGGVVAAVREATRQVVARMRIGPGPFLLVTGSPFQANVHVDSEFVGGVPWRGAVSPGRHELRVSADGHREHRQTVDVPANPGEEVTVQVDLEPIDGAPPPVAGASQPDVVGNLLIAGALALVGIAFTTDPVYTLANEGQCAQAGPGTTCTRRYHFAERSGVLLGVGTTLLAAGIVVAIVQPLTIAASVSTEGAHFQLRGRF